MPQVSRAQPRQAVTDHRIEVGGANPLGQLELLDGPWQRISAIRSPAALESSNAGGGAGALGREDARFQEERNGQESCAGQQYGLYVQRHGV